MATRKVQKLIYNTVIICLLAVALIYVAHASFIRVWNIPTMLR